MHVGHDHEPALGANLEKALVFAEDCLGVMSSVSFEVDPNENPANGDEDVVVESCLF